MTTKALLAVFLLGASMVCAPEAAADQLGCVGQATWDQTGRNIQRTLCDGPLRPDGSWQRCRTSSAASYFIAGSKGASLQGTWAPAVNTNFCSLISPSMWAPADEPNWWIPPVGAGPSVDAGSAGCDRQSWWDAATGRLLTRTLCDGPLQPDGGWQRCRSIFGPARWIAGQDNQGNWPPGFWVSEVNATKCDPVFPGMVVPVTEPWWIPS